jgi:hypothetical protein
MPKVEFEATFHRRKKEEFLRKTHQAGSRFNFFLSVRQKRLHRESASGKVKP